MNVPPIESPTLASFASPPVHPLAIEGPGAGSSALPSGLLRRCPGCGMPLCMMRLLPRRNIVYWRGRPFGSFVEGPSMKSVGAWFGAQHAATGSGQLSKRVFCCRGPRRLRSHSSPLSGRGCLQAPAPAFACHGDCVRGTTTGFSSGSTFNSMRHGARPWQAVVRSVAIWLPSPCSGPGKSRSAQTMP